MIPRRGKIKETMSKIKKQDPESAIRVLSSPALQNRSDSNLTIRNRLSD